MTDAADGYAGQVQPGESSDPIKAMARFVGTMMNRMNTATVVMVTAVHPGTAGSGSVDVQPMVNQVDGIGQAIPHGTVHGLPYFRYAAGGAAFIVDPLPGDIGVAVFASRDISAVKATGKPANPGSFRQNSMSDGFYFGGVLTQAAAVFVQVSADGVSVKAPNSITLDAPTIALKGTTVTHNGTNIGATHRHIGVQTGSGITGVPQP